MCWPHQNSFSNPHFFIPWSVAAAVCSVNKIRLDSLGIGKQIRLMGKLFPVSWGCAALNYKGFPYGKLPGTKSCSESRGELGRNSKILGLFCFLGSLLLARSSFPELQQERFPWKSREKDGSGDGFLLSSIPQVLLIITRGHSIQQVMEKMWDWLEMDWKLDFTLESALVCSTGFSLEVGVNPGFQGYSRGADPSVSPRGQFCLGGFP